MGNKMPTKWHKECANNWGKSIDREEKEVLSRLASVKIAKEQHEFYLQQIATAEKENRDGFDRDKYLVKRNLTTAST